MKTKITIIPLISLLVLVASHMIAAPLGTAFTYQGRLDVGTNASNGSFDLTFTLYDALSGGSVVGTPVTNSAVAVADGLFAVTLDFGAGAFPGNARWLEMAVRTNGSGAEFSALSPRQELTPAPNALYAASAASLNTTDNQPIELKVNNTPFLRLEPDGLGYGAPNVIGGSPANVVDAGVLGAVIAGGGASNYYDEEAGYFAITNRVGSDFSTIGGGRGNNIDTLSTDSTIGGGSYNTIQTFTPMSTIGGGGDNTIGTNAIYSTIGGGGGNTIMANRSTIGGGYYNTNDTYAVSSTIGGGENNNIQAYYCTIGGGYGNTIQSGNFGLDWNSTIGGGSVNTIQNAFDCTIGGGSANTIGTNALACTIGGGSQNTIGTNAFYSTIGGGVYNGIQTNAQYATIPGGAEALASSCGQMAYASGSFSKPGDAQTSVYVCRRTTTDATLSELFLDGIGGHMVVPVNSTWSFDVLVTARTAAGVSAGYHIRGVIDNNAGTTALVGALTTTVLAEDNAAWDATVVADNFFDALVVKVTGAAGTAIRWVATVRTAEVTY